MDKKVSYILKIKMSDFVKYNNESDESFEKRVKEEGKKRLRHYLSGYLFDPEHKTIFEEINFEELNK